MTPLDEFAESLLRERGLPSTLAPEVRDQMLRDLSERLLNFVNRRTIEALPEANVQELNAMLDGDPDPETFQSFIAANVPNQQQVVTDACIEFRGIYLGI